MPTIPTTLAPVSMWKIYTRLFTTTKTPITIEDATIRADVTKPAGTVIMVVLTTIGIITMGGTTTGEHAKTGRPRPLISLRTGRATRPVMSQQLLFNPRSEPVQRHLPSKPLVPPGVRNHGKAASSGRTPRRALRNGAKGDQPVSHPRAPTSEKTAHGGRLGKLRISLFEGTDPSSFPAVLQILAGVHSGNFATKTNLVKSLVPAGSSLRSAGFLRKVIPCRKKSSNPLGWRIF